MGKSPLRYTCRGKSLQVLRPQINQTINYSIVSKVAKIGLRPQLFMY